MAAQYDSGSDSDSKEKVERHPTSSEIYFTAVERNFRRQYRMVKSEFCLKELWKFYHNLVKSKPTAEEVLLGESDSVDYSFSDLTVIEDPTEDKRHAFLAKKYKYLLNGIAELMHCPEKPYLLIQKSCELDRPGRRFVLPRAIKATRPEVFSTTRPPFEGTIAYTKLWMNVSNLNFEVICARAQNSTQTEPADIVNTEKIVKKSDLIDPDKGELKRQREKFYWDIQVDLLDIPLDADGNPIGKRTGHCEWCKKEILPIPTPYVLSQTWERRQLFCCEKYRQLVDMIVSFERDLLAEKADKEILIDVRHKMKHLQAQPLPQPQPQPHEELEIPDTSRVEQGVKKPTDAPRLSTVGKLVKEAFIKHKASQERLLKIEQQDAEQDTTDLPWDPFESRYSKPKPFQNVDFDDPLDQVYQHASVALMQAEMYSAVTLVTDLGDLAGSSSVDDIISVHTDTKK